MLFLEAETLDCAKYFLTACQNQAKVYGMKFPAIEWNADGVFIRTVLQFSGQVLDPDTDSKSRHCSLTFPSFMAVPYQYKFQDPEVERVKYSGNRDFGGESTAFEPRFGAAVDAFAHHVVEDSFETLLIADIQGEDTGCILMIESEY
jgi:hypothetical protein